MRTANNLTTPTEGLRSPAMALKLSFCSTQTFFVQGLMGSDPFFCGGCGATQLGAKQTPIQAVVSINIHLLI